MQKKGWGGSRIPGPGKKIGRPPEDKIKRSFSLSEESVSLLDHVAKERKCSKSFLVERLIMLLSKANWKDDEFLGKRLEIPRLYIKFAEKEKDSKVFMK